MTTVTDSDLKRLEDLIVGGQRAVETRLTTLETRLTSIETRLTTIENGLEDIKAEIQEETKALAVGQAEIKGDIRTVEATLGGMSERTRAVETSTGKIPELAEKVGELKHWRQIGIIALTALISSTLTLVLRAGSLKP